MLNYVFFIFFTVYKIYPSTIVLFVHLNGGILRGNDTSMLCQSLSYKLSTQIKREVKWERTNQQHNDGDESCGSSECADTALPATLPLLSAKRT